MTQALQENWRARLEEVLCEHVGALGTLILEDVLVETGFRDREPNRREALHLFEVLKRQLPSQLQDNHVPERLLDILFGYHGEKR